MARIKQLNSPEGLTEEQRVVYDSIAGGARGGVRGPHTILLHNPKIAAPVERLGAFLRYECSVPERQRELAILIVAAHWQADYEWYAHAPLARKQGHSEEVLAAIAAREHPHFDDATDAAVHHFARELLEGHRVSDETYDRAADALGASGVLDLVALLGYYVFLAMTLNSFEVEPGSTSGIPWR